MLDHNKNMLDNVGVKYMIIFRSISTASMVTEEIQKLLIVRKLLLKPKDQLLY